MEEIYRLFITILGTHPFDLARSKIFRFPFLLYRTTLQKNFFFFFRSFRRIIILTLTQMNFQKR